MERSGEQAALEGARAEIAALSSEFATAAGPLLVAALRRRVQALLDAERDWIAGLRPDAADALREALDRAVLRGSAEAERRLADPELWLEPRTAPGVVPHPEQGWDAALPEWISGSLRRFAKRDERPSLDRLDDPGHRIWIAILSAAKPLDPVLEEFGLRPSPAPDLGGGHYKIQPKTAATLDPSGVLERLWGRYRIVLDRYESLTGDGP